MRWFGIRFCYVYFQRILIRYLYFFLIFVNFWIYRSLDGDIVVVRRQRFVNSAGNMYGLGGIRFYMYNSGISRSFFLIIYVLRK